MDNVIQRGTTYFGKEDEAIGKAGEIKSSNVDSEQQAMHFIDWKRSRLVSMVVQ